MAVPRIPGCPVFLEVSSYSVVRRGVFMVCGPSAYPRLMASRSTPPPAARPAALWAR